MSAVLEVRGLARRFGGVAALDGLDFTLAEGETRCVIGPNGAGKTTFLNVICGLIRPSSGSVTFQGRSIAGLSPRSIARHGMVRSFQAPTVFGGLGVGVNVELGARRPGMPRRDAPQRAARMLDEIGLAGRRDALASELSHGEKKRLEIAMLLAGAPQVLLLDEPTAGMGIRETDEIVTLLRRLCAGMTVVVIEHDMSFVRQMADSVSVFHRGALLTEGSLEEVSSDPRVQDIYLGDRVD